MFTACMRRAGTPEYCECRPQKQLSLLNIFITNCCVILWKTIDYIPCKVFIISGETINLTTNWYLQGSHGFSSAGSVVTLTKHAGYNMWLKVKTLAALWPRIARVTGHHWGPQLLKSKETRRNAITHPSHPKVWSCVRMVLRICSHFSSLLRWSPL